MTRLGLPLLLFAAACGGDAPVRPTLTLPVDLYKLENGPQWLDLWGVGLSSDPQYPACTPSFVPRDGTKVATPVFLTREWQGWVARSTEPAIGNIELRFHEAGNSRLGRAVAGTIRGWGLNVARFSLELPRDVRASLAGRGGSEDADVEGTIPPGIPFALGSISGEIRFSDRSGTSSSRCTKIQWFLQPKT